MTLYEFLVRYNCLYFFQKLRRSLTMNGIVSDRRSSKSEVGSVLRSTMYRRALLLFLFVFLILALPFTHWWFNGCDDFHGLYLGFRTKTWSELCNFFIDGHINQDSGPTNGHYNEQTNFLSTYYRPLYCVFLTLQYWLFGTNAYAYFVCNVFFHAINTGLLFLIFSTLSTPVSALFGALFFAFHPQVAYRFGAIVNLHYYVNVMLLLLILILLWHYKKAQRPWAYLTACFLFAGALFTRESSVVFPVIVWLLDYRIPAISFGCISLAFLSLRLYLYPLVLHPTTKNISVLLTNKTQEFLVFLYDCCGLSWLPWGRPMLRAAVLGSVLLLLLYFFINNRYKKKVITYFTCAACMMWPAVVGCYSPRYLYEALPFIITGFIVCYSGYEGRLLSYKKFTTATLFVIIVFYIQFTLECFSRREQKMHTFSKALSTLIENPHTHNRALCFLTYPMDGLGDHPSDIVRVLRNNKSFPILCDTAGALVQHGSNIIVPKRWKNVISPLYTKNYVTVEPVPEGFLFATSDQNKIRFCVSDNQCYSVGKKIVHDTGFTLIVDKQYWAMNPVFVVWNYETQMFDIKENL